MTIADFNTTKWGYGAVVYLIEVPTQTYDVHSVDFEDKTICIEDDSVTRWTHCEKCELVQSKKQYELQNINDVCMFYIGQDRDIKKEINEKNNK